MFTPGPTLRFSGLTPNLRKYQDSNPLDTNLMAAFSTTRLLYGLDIKANEETERKLVNNLIKMDDEQAKVVLNTLDKLKNYTPQEGGPVEKAWIDTLECHNAGYKVDDYFPQKKSTNSWRDYRFLD